MHVFMKTLTSKTITLDAEASDAIMSMRRFRTRKASILASVSPDLCGGKQLEDGRTLSDYKVQKECAAPRQEVFVKALMGKTTTLDADASERPR